MSGIGRKRSSKFDSREDLSFEAHDVRDRDWHRKAGMSLPDKESQHGSRGPQKDESDQKGHNINLDATVPWDGDVSYGARMSPGLDGWRKQHSCHSGSNGWSRSMRSSRSRSRSRSRSPAHGFKRESGLQCRNRIRSGCSSQLCRDFASGKCRRGTDCSFLHDDDNIYSDNWENRHRKVGASRYSSTPHDFRDNPLRSGRSAATCTEFMKGRCRRGASCKYAHDSAYDNESRRGSTDEITREKEYDRRNKDTSFDHRSEREPRKSGDIPCKFFAAGNCRNGRQCRYSHHTQAIASPERNSRDEVVRPRDDPKWSDSFTASDTAKHREDRNEEIGPPEPRSFARSLDDKTWGYSFNHESKTHADLVADHKTVQTNEKESLLHKVEDFGGSMGISESIGSEKWPGDMEMSPDWNYSMPSSKGEHGSITQASESLRTIPLATQKHEITQEATTQRHDAGSYMHPNVVEKTYFQQNHSSMQDDKAATEKGTVSYENGNFSAHARHAQNMEIPTDHPGAGTVHNPIILAVSTDGNSGLKPLEEEKMSVISAAATTKNIVSSEQLTELSNLSASLAQYLGKRTQIPQLYAALNSHNVEDAPSFSNSHVSVDHVSAASIIQGTVIESQKQYDPICDSIELRKLDNKPPGILANLTGQENVAEGKVQVPVGNMSAANISANEPRYESHTLSHREPAAGIIKEKNGVEDDKSKKMQEENMDGQENGVLENMDGDTRANDNKKNKDTKGIRAFKFALVEFVKEVLKSTWKEGRISKDAYKTIVKKVVDKVTGTMQGSSVPQTQEKIDHYLSSSKLKLTKLVQAYVEKAQKS